MSSLEAPTKEDLEQELLAFKHLAIFPGLIKDITLKVSSIGSFTSTIGIGNQSTTKNT